jgi:hypothetical protein
MLVIADSKPVGVKGRGKLTVDLGVVKRDVKRYLLDEAFRWFSPDAPSLSSLPRLGGGPGEAGCRIQEVSQRSTGAESGRVLFPKFEVNTCSEQLSSFLKAAKSSGAQAFCRMADVEGEQSHA